MTDYVELHCHSYFSFLDGAASPAQLVARAAHLGMPALALTDHNGVYGAVSFAQAAAQHHIHPIFGAELSLDNGHHLTLLAQDETGWGNLCWLITQAQHHAPKGTAALPLELLDVDTTEGLLALSGCRRGEIAAHLLSGDFTAARAAALQLQQLFGEGCFWIELQHHRLADDNWLVHQLVSLAETLRLPYLATNNVHYCHRADQPLQDVLTCIHHNLSLDEAMGLLRPASQYYLKSVTEMIELFEAYPQAIQNTVCASQNCDFQLSYGLQDLPQYPIPDDMTSLDYLRFLCQAAAQRGFGECSARVHNQLEYELKVIGDSGLANYFLIVWDIVNFARSQGILCQGRGSAANSLVAYLLGISPINPLDYDLVFERFLSPERTAVPDLDLDFQANRREEVIQYVYQTYGHEHVAMACTFVTYRSRSAIRDIGKAMQLPPPLLEQARQELVVKAPLSPASTPQTHAATALGANPSQLWEQFVTLCHDIRRFPRHVGIHNGGMVVSRLPLSRKIPIEPATMPDRFVVQWDKDALEAAGMVKIDLLGLRMLSVIADCRDMLGLEDFSHLTYNDPAVFEMIADADTIGVFQVESRAQQQMLPRFKPVCFEDLIVAISIIRPGPIQGQATHPYLRRRAGEEPVTYPHPLLEPVLKETLGVLLYQEQALKVAHHLAGFTPGQGELLRRVLASKDAAEAIEQLRDVFIAGARAKGVTEAVATSVFEQLRAFGGYSFPKSHATAFAVLVYQSAWLKRYYPAHFVCALLNNQPMGFWSKAIIVNDARRHGIVVLPVDINQSQRQCVVEEDNIRLGLTFVKGIGNQAAEQVMVARATTPFTDLKDFCQRTHLPRRLIEHLILAGAMDAWNAERRQLIWELGNLAYTDNLLGLAFAHDPVPLPALNRLEKLSLAYEMTHVALDDHPMAVFRPHLRDLDILDSQSLSMSRPAQWVQVAGLVTVIQAPPTANGHVFLTLEDEWGFINIIIRPKVYEVYRRIVRGYDLLLVEGSLQCRDTVTNVIATRITPLTQFET